IYLPPACFVSARNPTRSASVWASILTVFGRLRNGVLSGSRGLYRTNRIGPHHLVVFVLEDVAMPDELSRMIERRLHSGDFIGIGHYRVLGAGFPGFGRADISCGILAFDDLELGVAVFKARPHGPSIWLCREH